MKAVFFVILLQVILNLYIMKKIFTFLGVLSVVAVANAQIVINEVYGGGGNSGATYTHDFVELINKGTQPVTLSGATLQYASAANAFNAYHTLPEITLNPGQTYLIQEAKGSGGSTALPTPDFVATTLINFSGTTNSSTDGFSMSSSNLKIVLASNNIQVVSPTDSNVIDFVGVGTANQYEGAGPAPAMTNTTSVSRTNGVDTNDNSVDFKSGTPTPSNTSMLGVSDSNASKVKFIKNTLVTNTIEFSAKANVKIYSVNGHVVKTAAVNDGTSLDISALAKGVYVVAGDVDGHSVSQKIIKK